MQQDAEEDQKRDGFKILIRAANIYRAAVVTLK
jgi:hypothetical protein